MIDGLSRLNTMTTTTTIPNRCVCGYKLDVRPCPYHGTTKPMTAPLPAK